MPQLTLRMGMHSCMATCSKIEQVSHACPRLSQLAHRIDGEEEVHLVLVLQVGQEEGHA